MRSISLNAISTRLRVFVISLTRLGNKEIRLEYLKRVGLVSIGDYTYGKPIVFAWDEKTKLRIGKYCSIAEEVTFILGGNHNVNWVSSYPFSEFTKKWPSAAEIKGHPSTRGDINVGNDVWIGHGALILSGVKIGDGAVIGAASVVSRDVAPYSIVVGNPAKEIRYRFSPEEIDKLLKIQWWDWPEEVVAKNINYLCGGIEEGLPNLENNV